MQQTEEGMHYWDGGEYREESDGYVLRQRIDDLLHETDDEYHARVGNLA